MTLLFRGSKDGFKSAAFHKNCDNKGATLTIVKSEYGKIFGAFTYIPWEISGGSLLGEYKSG